MKKIFALILMSLAVCVNANAGWWKQYHKADELREQEAYYANVYSGSGGHFICWSNSDRVRIECYDGIFDDGRCARIGFYKDGKMINMEKFVSIHQYSGDYDQVYINEFIGYKIIYHLKYVGDVRIIAPKWSGADLDITIPMNPNLITDIPKITESIVSLTNAKDIEIAYHNIEDTINANKKAMRNLPKDSNEYKAKKSMNSTLRDRLDELDMKYYELTGEYIYNYGGEN